MEQTQPVETLLASVGDDLAKKKIADLFGMDKVDVEEGDYKLTEILNWCKTKTNKIEDVENLIADMKAKLSSPSFGEKPINAFYRYIFLVMEKDKIEEKIRKAER